MKFLVRHTKISNPFNLCYGRFEMETDESFETEAKIIESKLKKKYPENIITCSLITSPSKRCLKLADYLNRGLSLRSSPIVDSRLLEYNFGDWEGVPWDKISRRESRDWMEDYVNIAPPNGETMIAFQNRVLDFWNEWKNNDNTIIITHGGWIRIFIANSKNLPLEKVFDIQVDYGSIHPID